ncbi:hypothetical protein FHG87_012776 [Trinorchestia longiramus]|nr:hypothetical protein FHG87_012776 [Trinorchestia longiramus]
MDRVSSSPLPRYRRGPTQPNRLWRNYVLEDFLQYIGSGEGSTEEWHHQSRDTAWLELQSSPIKAAPLPTYAYLQSPHFISSSTSPTRITIVSTVYKTSTEYATTLYSTRTPLVTATVKSISKPSATWQELYTSCSHHVVALESDQKEESILSSTIATGNKIHIQTQTMFVTSTVTSTLIETKTVTDPTSFVSRTYDFDFEPTAPIVIAPSPTTSRLQEPSTVVLLTPSDKIPAGSTESILSTASEETSTSELVSSEEPASTLLTVISSSIVPTTDSSLNITDSLNTVSPSYYPPIGTTESFSAMDESLSTNTSLLTENTTELTAITSSNDSNVTESGTNFTITVTESVPTVIGSLTPLDNENSTSTDGVPPPDHGAVFDTLSSTSATEPFTLETPTEISSQSTSSIYDTPDLLRTEGLTTIYTTEYLFDRTGIPNLATDSSTSLPSQTQSPQDLNLTSGVDTQLISDVSTSTDRVLYENVSEPVSFPSTTESDSTTQEEFHIYIEGSGTEEPTTLSSSGFETSGRETSETEIATSTTDFVSTTLSYSFSHSSPHTTTELLIVTPSPSTSLTFESTESSVPVSKIPIELQTSSSTPRIESSTPKSFDFPPASSTSTSLAATSAESTRPITSPSTQLTTSIPTTQVTSSIPATALSTKKAISSEEASTSITLPITIEMVTIDDATLNESTVEAATISQSTTTSSSVATITSTPIYTIKTGINAAPDPEFWVRTIIEGKLLDADIEENKIETGLSEVFRSAFGYGRNEDSELLKNLGERVTLNIPRSDDPQNENRIRRETFLSGFASPSAQIFNSKKSHDSYHSKTNYRSYILNNQIAFKAQQGNEVPLRLARRRRQLPMSSLQETDEINFSPVNQSLGSIRKVDVPQFETAFLARNIETINAKIHNISHDAQTNKTDIIYVVYDGSSPIPADEAVASLRNIINERMSDAIGYKVHLTEEYLRSNEGTSRLTWLETNVWIWYVLAFILLLLVFVIFTSTYCLYWKKRSYKSSGTSDAEERRSARTFGVDADVERSPSGRTSTPTMDAGEESSTSSNDSQREEEASALRPQIRKSRQLRDSGEGSGPSGWPSRSSEPGQGGSHRHLPPPRLPRLAAPMHNLPFADLPPSILRPPQFKNQKEASSEEATSVPETDTDDNAFLGRPGSYRRIRRRFHELLADAFNILDGGQKADRVDTLTGHENSAVEDDVPLPKPVPSTSGRSLVSAKLARMRNFTLSGNKRTRKNFIGPTGLSVPSMWSPFLWVSAPPSAPAELGRLSGGSAPWKSSDPYLVPRPRSAADLLQHTRVQPLDHISPSAGVPVPAWGEAALGRSRPSSARCITPVNLPSSSSPPSRGPASPPHTTSPGEAALAESLGLKVGDPAVPLIMDIKETLNTLRTRGVQRPRPQRYNEGPAQEQPRQ